MRQSTILLAGCAGLCAVGVFLGEPYLTSLSVRVLSVETPQTTPESVLFSFDDYSIPFRKNLYLTLEHASKYSENPILRRGPEGSADEARAQFHGTVLRVNGKFRMWYVAIDSGDLKAYDQGIAKGVVMAGPPVPRLAYAESEDGFHWRKPNLGLREYHGSKANNLVDLEMPILWPSVMYEPGEPDVNKRYKMMFKGFDHSVSHFRNYRYLVTPLCAYSPDGLHWRLAEHNPPIGGNMEGTNFYKFSGNYFVQGHIVYPWGATTGMLMNGEPTGRVLFTYRSPDFIHWTSEPALSFTRYGYRAGHISAVEESHTAGGAWNRGNVILSAYLQWHGVPEVDSRWMDVGFMISNDGLHFREPIPDFQLVSRGEKGSWEGGSLWGVSFLNVGEKTLIYYSGLNRSAATASGRGDIGVAMLDRDRFGYLSLKNTAEVGEFTSAPVELGDRARLFANVSEVSPNASIQIGLVDDRNHPIAGYSLKESKPLTAPGLRQPVAWNGGAVIRGLGNKKLYVKSEIRSDGNENPHLYAVYLDPAP